MKRKQNANPIPELSGPRSRRMQAKHRFHMPETPGIRSVLLLAFAFGMFSLPCTSLSARAEVVETGTAETGSGQTAETGTTEAGTGQSTEAAEETAEQNAEQVVQSATSVDYNNLEQLVQNNRNLKNSLENYTTNKETYQNMLSTLETERDYMKFMQEKYEDDAETKAVYKMNASRLSMSISQITKQLESLETKTQSVSRQKTIDSYVLTAQSLMRTYNQMNTKAQAEEKNYEAAQSSYQAMLKKQSAGVATAADVMAAADTMASAKNRYESYRQQAANARFNLLSNLGLEDNSTITIGTVPLPDLAAIDAVDFDADVETAVGNSSSVQNARHQSAGTATEISVKSDKETQAEGTVRSQMQSLYDELKAAKLQYEGAANAYESASITYASLQKKQQAGMLSQSDYLQGVADYYSALDAKESAVIQLNQAWESYNWTVKGVS